MFDEVEDLRQEFWKHFDELHKAQDAKKIAESKHDDAIRAIKTDLDNIQAERDE